MKQGSNVTIVLVAIVGRYTPDGQAEIEGSPLALQELAKAISGGTYPLIIPLCAPAQLSPEPYEHFLNALQIFEGGGAIHMRLEGGTLAFDGTPELLTILGENIATLAEDVDLESGDEFGEHMHIEYYPDHFYLAPSDIALVIQVRLRQAR